MAPAEAPAVHWFAALPSTMEEAHRLAAAGAPHGTAVAAREQTAGRGTRGRTWASPVGGLWMSVICRPLSATSMACFSLRVGLALVRALELETGLPPLLRLKWPNDVYLEGRKLAGILCEARWQGAVPSWVVAGIGMNVSNPLPAELGAMAAALSEVHRGASADTLAMPVARAVAAAAIAGGPLSPGELKEFATRDFLAGRRLRAPVAGTAAGITTTGALVIHDDQGARHDISEARVELAGA